MFSSFPYRLFLATCTWAFPKGSAGCHIVLVHAQPARLQAENLQKEGGTHFGTEVLGVGAR